MRKTIVLAICCLFASIAGAQAQEGGTMPRRTVEERVKMVMEKLTPALKLDNAQATQADSAFAGYYRSMEKLRAGMQQGERPDRAQFEKLTGERDEKLKKIFTADQYKKFKDEVEPSLRPQRGGGGNRPQA